jgi:hypothetical protein
MYIISIISAYSSIYVASPKVFNSISHQYSSSQISTPNFHNIPSVFQMMLPLYLLPMVAVLASAISESAKDVVDDVDLLINPADNGNMHIDADEEGNVEVFRYTR